MWESLVDHAKTCVLSGKHYVYYSDDKRNIGAIFNNVYEFRGLIADGHYYSAETLSDGQKVNSNHNASFFITLNNNNKYFSLIASDWM